MGKQSLVEMDSRIGIQEQQFAMRGLYTVVWGICMMTVKYKDMFSVCNYLENRNITTLSSSREK